MTRGINESVLENATLDWFAKLGYEVVHGPDIEPDSAGAERQEFAEVVLSGRLRDALMRLNPDVPDEAIEEAYRKITITAAPALETNNRTFHDMLVNGVTVEYRTDDGRVTAEPLNLVDFENPDNNDWLAVNQFKVIENRHNRRPDIVVFVNGLPLAVIELKNPADEDATIWAAFNQLQTYKKQIPSLFTYNEALIISDGMEARIGSLTADRERFMPWRTVQGDDVAPLTIPQLNVLIHGVFEKARFLDMLKYFIVFEEADVNGEKRLVKKMAAYHQFHAVRVAVESTAEASSPRGDRRCGVVWHTQGSGKSLTMAFFAGKIIQRPGMDNPTIVVITDRNDLDDQLFGTFSSCSALLRQTPVQVRDREDLKEKLKVASGGVVFTTIQKFMPEEKGQQYPMLSDRRNIIVIADEAHRSQYDFIDGFARHMRDALPNASFIGFTGTPVEMKDKDTRAVFGDEISIYDIQRAVEDGATVQIFYDSRLAMLDLDEAEKPTLDEEFEEVTEGEEIERKEKLKSKWAALEALAGADKRVKLIADDLVQHFEDRIEALEGKAMIVCMSRRICVDLYKAIIALRPEWHDPDVIRGQMKIVMTGSASDPAEWQDHIYTKKQREDLAERFKKPDDPLKIVIVRDMWLTGFDAPCLHTMYVDKPMRGHGLMQAIARVNRVFRDKQGGLVVDYIGLADSLKKALAVYTESGGKGRTAIDKAEAVAMMLEKYEICCDMFHGFDWSAWTTGKPSDRLSLLANAKEHILTHEDGKKRFMQAVTALSQAFTLAVPHNKTKDVREDVSFFQAVRAGFAKFSGEGTRSPEETEFAIKQLVSRAVSSNEVIDIFAAAGLNKPDISILSDEFLAEVRGMPQKNLAVELLEKLLKDEIKSRSRKRMVQARSFAEMLEKAIRAYRNRAVETAKVIEEMIEVAKKMNAAYRAGEELGLSEDELAFYDALETNDSAVKVLGDEKLKIIARELVDAVKRNASIDWSARESVRAKMRTIVKRILRNNGYPPDKQEKATITVMEQAEHLAEDWAVA